MKITKSLRQAIDNMKSNPHHENIRPSNLIKSNAVYRGLTADDINFCKTQAFPSVPLEGPIVTTIDNNNNQSKKTIESPYPLTSEELAELVGADGINVRVDRIWSKSHKNGSWTYSVLTVTAIKDFYSRIELEKRLSQLLPKCATIKLPKVRKVDDQLLTLTLADIHAGSLGNPHTPFPTDYSESILKARLHNFFHATNDFVGDKKYEQVWMINLGDSINSWQGQTTRKGHNVPSESNRRQFDIFINAMSEYYENMFESGISNSYKVISCLNDNHCFPEYVEVLTDSGFKLFKDVESTDLIASEDINGNIVYEKPIATIYNEPQETILHTYRSKSCEIDVTSKHNMNIRGTKPNDIYKLVPSHEVIKKESTFNFKCALSNFNADFDVSDDMIKLAAWVGSDGSVIKAVRRDTDNYNEKLSPFSNSKYSIHQREEKAHYITEVLNNLGISYNILNRDNCTPTEVILGKTLKSQNKRMLEFSINRTVSGDEILEKLNEFIPSKYTLPNWIKNLSKRQFLVYLNTFILGDGTNPKPSLYKGKECKVNSAVIYGVKSILDQLQHLCVSFGVRASISEYRPNTFRLNITFNTDKAIIDPKKQGITEIPYNGFTWCFTMPSGKLVVRQNGKVSIQGNSGVDLSYMATKTVELYLQSKYPEVEFIHQEKFIDVYNYGNHNIAMAHGKDEALMKFGWKANLDDKLDNWLTQFFLHKQHNPTKQFNHLYKGDLHLHNTHFGKFGRYINFPSVMGTSDYIALNYGFSKSGGVIEEIDKHSNKVISQPVWFQ